MSTTIHDTATCPCEMCVWADRQEKEMSLTTDDAVLDDDDAVLLDLQDFQKAWQEAPRGMRDHVEAEVAIYWYLKGKLDAR